MKQSDRLIPGSTVSLSDKLTPETQPWQMLDPLQRVQANHLFCGRLGLVLELLSFTSNGFPNCLNSQKKR